MPFSSNSLKIFSIIWLESASVNSLIPLDIDSVTVILLYPFPTALSIITPYRSITRSNSIRVYLPQNLITIAFLPRALDVFQLHLFLLLLGEDLLEVAVALVYQGDPLLVLLLTDSRLHDVVHLDQEEVEMTLVQVFARIYSVCEEHCSIVQLRQQLEDVGLLRFGLWH